MYRLLVLALVVLVAIVIGLVAGILSSLGGAHPATAVRDGCAAAGAALTILVLVLRAFGLL